MESCKWEGCGLGFPSVEKLGRHLEVDHLSKVHTSFVCLWEGCERGGNQLASKFALSSHLRKHTGEKPFECPICQKHFSRSDALAKHAKSHELPEDVVELKPVELTNDEAYLASLRAQNDLLKLQLHLNSQKVRCLRAQKIILLDKLLETSYFNANLI